MVDVLDELRARIREVEGHVGTSRGTVRSGCEPLDARLGGLPSPGIVEVVGAPGVGRTRLVLGWGAASTRRGEPVAWVDPEGGPYAVAAEALGVELERLLVVRPPPDRAAWAVEEVVRSGCFGLVVACVVPEGALVGRRWEAAAREGRTTLVVLGEVSATALPAALRVEVEEGHALVHRRRGPGGAVRVVLPPWPTGLDPWGGAG